MSDAPLSDHQQIVNITHDYCWALDGRQWGDLDNVFLPNATAQLGHHSCKDRDEIKAVVDRALSKLDASQHIVATHQITIDADTATSRCYLHAQHVRHAAEGGPHFIVAGTYSDTLTRTPDGWRIAHRDLTIIWREGNVRVVRPDGD